MADRNSLIPLTREVLPPQKPSNGLGVLMVASLAMFFAVASSAFVLHARVTRPCARPAIKVAPVQRPMVMPNEVQITEWREPDNVRAATFFDSARECGTPVFRSNSDGSVTVHYTACPEGKSASIRSISGIEVIDIH